MADTRPALNRFPLAALCASLLALTACGGGNADNPAAPAAEAAVGIAAVIGPIGGSPGTTNTAGVLCPLSGSEFNADVSVQLAATYSWTCTATGRVLAANGVPNHPVGAFPNAGNPNKIGAQTVGATYTLTPKIANKTGTGTAAQAIGYGLNGVKFDPGTAGSCNDAGTTCSLIGNVGTWSIEALGQPYFNFGTDGNNAHVQPNGAYHYHGMPEGLVTKLGGDTTMRLVGWAADGYPVYARKGYVRSMEPRSGLKTLVASYRVKATPDANRPPVSLYAMGTFRQDWEYVAGLGDLDECNGRSGVTPEFPAGTYHYVVTDNYPYIQRCVKGTPATGGLPPPPPPPTLSAATS